MIIRRSKSMREKVYDTLKSLIFEGKIAPGERIIETEYSKKFDISRTPLREAIRMLENEGLVETQAKGGVTVKKVTKEEIVEIYKIRIALESLILEEVIKKAKEEDLEKVRQILLETKDAFNADDTATIFELFSKFNIALYEIANLPRVENLINNINSYLRRFRKLSISNSKRREVAYNDHLAIFQTIKNKDLENATLLNRNHLEKSMAFILSELTNSEAKKSDEEQKS